MKRQDEQAVPLRKRPKLARRPADLLDARQKRQHIPPVGRAFDRLRNGPRHAVGQGRAVVAPMRDVHGKCPPLDPDDRRIAEERGHGPGVHRGRHDDQDQVVADRLADFLEEGQRQVGVEAPLVELVEHDRADAFEERVGDDLAVEDALGEDS